MYLAIVMDLYSRRIVGWQIEKHMTIDLISKALIKAVSLRQPKTGTYFIATETHNTRADALVRC